MSTYRDPTTGTAPDAARTASVLNVIAGIWLIISPFVLAFSLLRGPMWNNIIVGAIVVIFAWIRAANPTQNVGLSWVNLLLGIWTIISPFVLVYSMTRPTALAWNNVILGIIIGVLGIWSAMAAPFTTGRLMNR
jgi:hypothetical protein